MNEVERQNISTYLVKYNTKSLKESEKLRIIEIKQSPTAFCRAWWWMFSFLLMVNPHCSVPIEITRYNKGAWKTKWIRLLQRWWKETWKCAASYYFLERNTYNSKSSTKTFLSSEAQPRNNVYQCAGHVEYRVSAYKYEHALVRKERH